MSTTYFVREENIERLEKKLATLAKKCKSANCTFIYRLTGNEEFRTANDDNNEDKIYHFI